MGTRELDAEKRLALLLRVANERMQKLGDRDNQGTHAYDHRVREDLASLARDVGHHRGWGEAWQLIRDVVEGDWDEESWKAYLERMTPGDPMSDSFPYQTGWYWFRLYRGGWTMIRAYKDPTAGWLIVTGGSELPLNEMPTDGEWVGPLEPPADRNPPCNS